MKSKRFTLDNTAIRGEIIRLDEPLPNRSNTFAANDAVGKLLAEFHVAAALLASTLKFTGRLSLQANSEGLVPLIMAECTSDGQLRGIAKTSRELISSQASWGLQDLLAKGTLAITIEPEQGKRYQGIVPLQGTNLAECLEHYFEQSEQLATRLWFRHSSAHPGQVAALMLQVLPSMPLIEDDWDTAVQLASTVTAEELFQLDSESLLFRLFNTFSTRVQDDRVLQYQCSCSTQRGRAAIQALGAEEANELLRQHGKISIHCEFCDQHYVYNADDIFALFGNSGTQTTH